jgi:hypothetical protein
VDVGEAATANDFGVKWQDFELGIHELAVLGLLGAGSAPGEIHAGFEQLRLVEPAIHVARTPEGLVLPLAGAAARAGASPAPPDPPRASVAPSAPALRVDVDQLQIERGRVEILDRTPEPFYRSKVDRLDLRARGVHWPGPRADRVQLALKGFGGAALDANGSAGSSNSTLALKLSGLSLPQFNAYVTRSGYSIGAGSLALDTNAKLAGNAVDSTTKVLVSQLDIGGARGESLFLETFGIPLSIALGLLKDLRGNIALSVPFAGDRGAAKLGLGSIVTQALRKALIGALASPLKLFGAVTANGKVEKLEPEPVTFVPGTARLAAEGASRIEQLAGLLSASPGISLTLNGEISEQDLRVFRERALLAELRATSGLRALASLREIGTRRAVRSHLEAKLGGREPAELDPGSAAWLEAHAAEQAVDRAALEALAQQRAEVVQRALVADSGIAPERLALGPAVAEPPAPQAGVAISLGARPGASASPPGP